MELRQAVLVVVDISGYTRFVVLNRISVLHAEQIVTDLIEAVAAEARVPLSLNKLEGDAALFVGPFEIGREQAVADVLDQVTRFFEAFRAKRKELFDGSIGGCICSACQSVENLRLKAFVHADEVVFKRVGGFEEIAGKGVILIHRLMKNTLQGDEYLLVTRSTAARVGLDAFPVEERHMEEVEQLGSVECIACFPPDAVLARPDVRPLTRLRGMRESVRLFVDRTFAGKPRKGRKFANILGR